MDPGELTLDAYLDEWLALLRTRVQPTTRHGYELMARYYLRPQLGAEPLRALTPRRLSLHYLHLLEAGGRRGRPLSRRTVAYTHAVLRSALSDAVRDGLLTENVALRASVPKLDPFRADDGVRALQVWDAAQAARFLEQSAGHRLHDLWRVALGTGMRRGELLGLRWEDLDLDVPQLRVATSLAMVDGQPRLKPPKTARSRVLSLDDDTAAALARQPRRDDAPLPLVFTRDDGQPWHPRSVSLRWARQWPGLDVPRLRLHDLRHCHATLLLAEGVPMKVVSERLGHASIVMTMDIYAHVLPAQDLDAAAAIARALRPARASRR